jgi:hypothetical protein
MPTIRTRRLAPMWTLSGTARKKRSLWVAGALVFGLFLGLPASGLPYTVVTISTSAPQGLETSFIASTTNQYLSTLFVNPLFAGTYQLLLYGQNPDYNPPPTTLEDALSLGATVYVYGFANGMTYQQTQIESMTVMMGSLCASATDFNLVNTSTMTFDTNTCFDVISTIEDSLYELSLSTPTPLPPEP